MIQSVANFFRDLKLAARSLGRAKGLTLSVILTLALGIGANAAMFTLLRGVLLRPLVNRDESRLIYIRQSTEGKNAWFSVPEIDDLTSRVKRLNSFGDFSIIGFTLVGLGEPRSVQAGVVGGSYFQAMGSRSAPSQGRRRHGDRRTCPRLGLRVLAGETIRHSSGGRENARPSAGGRFGVGDAACRCDCVGDTRVARTASRVTWWHRL